MKPASRNRQTNIIFVAERLQHVAESAPQTKTMNTCNDTPSQRERQHAYNLAAVETGTCYERFVANVVTNAAFTPQARRAARLLGVTLTNHGKIATSIIVVMG